MRALLISLLVLHGALAHAAESGRPMGENCNLAAPPANAGEEFNHGITLKIYPRARDIHSSYTGCQTTWMPQGNKWLVLTIVAIERGDAVRIWTPDKSDPARFSCIYKAGKIVKGDAQNCVAPQFLIAKSLAPGCVARIAKASGQFPPDCKYE